MRARELDVVTGLWNSVVAGQAQQADSLRHAVLRTVLAAFAPLARIESADGKSATLRLRAGGIPRRDRALARSRPARFSPRAGNERRPRRGAAGPGRADSLDVPCTDRKAAGPLVTCRIETGLAAAPIPEFHPQCQRWALAVSPSADVTNPQAGRPRFASRSTGRVRRAGRNARRQGRSTRRPRAGRVERPSGDRRRGAGGPRDAPRAAGAARRRNPRPPADRAGTH